jgi:hypothetical protein
LFLSRGADCLWQWKRQAFVWTSHCQPGAPTGCGSRRKSELDASDLFGQTIHVQPISMETVCCSASRQHSMPGEGLVAGEIASQGYTASIGSLLRRFPPNIQHSTLNNE